MSTSTLSPPLSLYHLCLKSASSISTTSLSHAYLKDFSFSILSICSIASISSTKPIHSTPSIPVSSSLGKSRHPSHPAPKCTITP